MADRYVYSGAGGTGSGADWTNAHTTLSAAITASAAGDRFVLAHDHVQTQASALTLAFKGVANGARDQIICVNRAGSVPPVPTDLLTTAQVIVTGNFAMTITGNFRCYGVKFSCGSSTASSALTLGADGNLQDYESSDFKLGGTGAQTLRIAPNRAKVRLINCTTQFAATSHQIFLEGEAHVIGPVGANFFSSTTTLPSTLIGSGNLATGRACRFIGVDLSSLGSGKTIYNGSSNNAPPAVIFEHCKFNSAVTLFAAASNDQQQPVELIGCDLGGGTAQKQYFDAYRGTIRTETTIVRAGGATDGSTPFSYKMASNGNTKKDFPLDSFEGTIFNSATGSAKTLSVYCVTDNVTLKDDEIWLEIDYLGDSASPLSTRADDRVATILTAGANQTADSSTWTTTGLTTPVKQKLDVTFTPQLPGPVRWRVRLGKASTTVYVCPKAELT